MEEAAGSNPAGSTSEPAAADAVRHRPPPSLPARARRSANTAARRLTALAPQFAAFAGLLVLGAAGGGGVPPETPPPPADEAIAEETPSLPTPVGAAMVFLLDGTRADVDVIALAPQSEARVRTAIARLSEGTDWRISAQEIATEPFESVNPSAPPMWRTYATFKLTGALLEAEGALPVGIFARAFVDLSPFSCTFAVPTGLHGQAPFRWDGEGVGARLLPNAENSAQEFEYYIATPDVLALLDPPPVPAPIAEPPPPRAGPNFLLWLISGIIAVAGAAIMVGLYIARHRSQKA